MKASPTPDPAASEVPVSPPAADSGPAVPLPAPKEPPKTATWPEWFGAVDFVLVVLVLVLGFLAASFPARNPDLWFHLANGRNLVEGKYTPGADPYSFTGANRGWADTSWLYDLTLYALYSIGSNGTTAVAVKAVVFALAFGLLFLLRKPGQPFWPWAVFIALGVLSAGQYAPLRPVVWSMLFLTATLLILFYWRWQPGTWRQPLVLAGLFALWANFDGWFILGPLTVFLVFIGELIHGFLAGVKEPQTDSPVPPAPPTRLLGRALVLGIAGCLLNPMLLAALAKDPGNALSQLIPVEFGIGIPDGSAKDYELSVLSLRPVSPDSFFLYHAGQFDAQVKLPSVTYAILVVASLIALGAGYARIRASHILLWVGFAALSIIHSRLIPFFAIVAAPLAAAHLNGLSSRIHLGSWTETPTRLMLTGSALGRVLTVLAVLLTIGATYPGWIHNPQPDPAYVNRLEWVIVPDASLVRSARQLARLRAELPETTHGLNMSTEFGDYCAWYAPSERVFINGRLAFHRPELPDFLTVRHAVIGRRPPTDIPDTDEVTRVCEARNVGFLTYASRSQLDGPAVLGFLQDEARWSVWHLDGRFLALGRVMAVGQELADRLHFNPVRLAFGPEQAPLPEGSVLQPLRVTDDSWEQFWNDYLARPEPLPPEVDDVEMLIVYGDYLRIRALQHWQAESQHRQIARGAILGIPASMIMLPNEREPRVDEARLALPVVVARLARLAVASSPDRADVYRALSLAYGQQYAPTTTQPLDAVQMSEQQIQVITALARYLARVPPIERCSPAKKREIFRAAMQLNMNYRQTGQLDLSREVFGRMVQLSEVMAPEDFRDYAPRGAKLDESIKTFLKGLRDEEDNLIRLVQQHTRQVDQQNTPAAKFWTAANAWPPGRPAGRLPGKAIEIFKSATSPNEFGTGEAQLQVVLQLIVMELQAGRLEDAASDLAALGDEIKRLSTTQPGHQVTAAFRALQGVKDRLTGNFAAAAESMPRSPAPLDAKFVESILGLPVNLPQFDPRATETWGGVIGSPAGIHQANLVVRQVMMMESDYQYDRAMLALSDGNIPEARRRLEQAAKPQGHDLARIGNPSSQNQLSQINRYLDMIRQASGSPAPPTRR